MKIELERTPWGKIDYLKSDRNMPIIDLDTIITATEAISPTKTFEHWIGDYYRLPYSDSELDESPKEITSVSTLCIGAKGSFLSDSWNAVFNNTKLRECEAVIVIEEMGLQLRALHYNTSIYDVCHRDGHKYMNDVTIIRTKPNEAFLQAAKNYTPNKKQEWGVIPKQSRLPLLPIDQCDFWVIGTSHDTYYMLTKAPHDVQFITM